jgi:hypothetical protein
LTSRAATGHLARLAYGSRRHEETLMKTLARTALFVSAVLVLTACAAGTPDASHAAASGPVSQIVLGFWHGLIAPVTLLIEVIHRYIPGVVPWDWRLYEGEAAGVPYDVGFYFGLAGGPSFLFWRR